MATVTATKESFDNLVSSADIVLVDFWVSWCGPCRSFGPVFEKASEVHPDLVFGKVDTQAEQELAQAFGILSIPTLMVLRDKVIVFREAGAMSAPALDELIQLVRDLDMDDMYRRVAETKVTP